ncbi:MAG: universal stress protein [Methyloligellaceae bacterium]
MTETRRRRVFEEGRLRKFLVVLDETTECEGAMAFAANRVRRTGGRITFLYVVEPGDFQHWLGVKEIAREEAFTKARAVFRLYTRKLKNMGFEELEPEEIIREGQRAEEILKLIEEDRDIAILVLGASEEPNGPGPLVSSFAAGQHAGRFPIPISIVPGHLSPEEIEGLA